MFCFGLKSIAYFIDTNASYFNTHTLESEETFSIKRLNLIRKKIEMLFTGLGQSVLGETVPSARVPPRAVGRRRYSRPRAQFLPIPTSQPVNSIYLFW